MSEYYYTLSWKGNRYTVVSPKKYNEVRTDLAHELGVRFDEVFLISGKVDPNQPLWKGLNPFSYYTTNTKIVKLDESTGKNAWEYSGEEIDQLLNDLEELRELKRKVEIFNDEVDTLPREQRRRI